MNENLPNDLEEQEPDPSNITNDVIPADDELPEAVDYIRDEETTDDEFIVDAPPALDFTFSASGLDDLDIESALASITGLDAAIAEHANTSEAETLAIEPEPAVDPEQVRRETESRRKATHQISQHLEQPPFRHLGRGQLASVIPAVLLMMLGTGLTVYLAEPTVFEGVSLNNGLLGVLLAGMFGVMLISYWLSSGRWAGGALSIGLSVLATIGIFALNLADSFPLILSGLGGAIFITALLSRGTVKYQYFVGVALLLSGVIGYSFNLNINQFDLTRLQPILFAILGVFAVLLLIIPLFAKKQR